MHRLAPLVLLLAAGTVTAADASTPPNIVFILADDLGIGDVHCYGGDRCLIETPHIDSLAAGGLRFTDAHVSASVCVPTRVGVMTGRYPWRFGSPRPGGPWGYLGPRFEPGTLTLGTMLRRAGYRTGYVGKWHLGTVMRTTDGEVQGPENVDYLKPLEIGPAQHGFDDSFILPGSLDMFPYAFVRDGFWVGRVTARKGWSAFNRVGPAAEDFEDHHVLARLGDEGEAFIRRQKADRPFFLYLALTAPHTPISPGEAFRGRSKLGPYGDFVMEVDHAVERVVAALESKGFDGNTLILFSSDHGPASYAGNIPKATPGQIHQLEEAGHFPSGPHRGYKFSVYEGGLRVPLVARWPGMINPGGTCDALVGLNDLMATFADLAGKDLGPREAPDSISFAPLLRDPTTDHARTDLVMQSIGPFVLRHGPWKLCLCPGSGATGRYGNEPTPEVAWRAALDRFDGTPTRADLVAAPFVQLFNVVDDPHEDRNLAAEQPERVADMLALLRRRVDEGRSTAGPRLTNDGDVDLHPRLPEFVRRALK